MDFKIRKAKPSDAEEIAVLYLQFWKTHKDCDPLLEPRRSPTLRSEAALANQTIRKRNVHIFVATANDRIVGSIELIIKSNDEADFRIRRYGYLNSVIVHEDYRRKGIAAALIETGLDFLKKKGIEYVKVGIYDFNKASLGLLIESGFRSLSRIMIKEI